MTIIISRITKNNYFQWKLSAAQPKPYSAFSRKKGNTP